MTTFRQPRIRHARTADGASVAYSVTGTGHPLLYLPGTILAPAIGFQLADEFRTEATEQLTRIRRVVRYDSRGSGLSSRGSLDYSLDAMVEEVEAIVDDLGLTKLDLFGPFAGGAIAVAYASRHPGQVSSLTLYGASAQPRGVGAAEEAVAALAALDWDTFVETFVRVQLRMEGKLARVMAETVRENTTLEAYRAYTTAAAEFDISNAAPLVRAPTIVLASAGDAASQAAAHDLAARIPGADVQILAGDGRAISTDVLLALAAFLEEQVAGQVAPQALQTILFTDLEGSTALTQHLGDEGAQELLRGHNAAVRVALDEHGGHEVKHTGDGIMASFPSAVAAVTAALAMQRDLAGGEVRVRIGLNAGEPIAEDDDLFGLSVIKAARIGDRAEPGQVLVSDVVRQLCEGKTFQFTSIGDVTLKGFDEPVALYEVRT